MTKKHIRAAKNILIQQLKELNKGANSDTITKATAWVSVNEPPIYGKDDVQTGFMRMAAVVSAHNELTNFIIALLDEI